MNNCGINTSSKLFKVNLLSYKISGWIFVVVFSCGLIGAAFFSEERWPIAGFLFFILLGGYIILNTGNYFFSLDEIIHQTVFGKYRILWDEINNIEVGNYGTLVFHGANKRFVVAPPSCWSGSEKSEAYSALQKKIDQSGIKPYPSSTGDYKIHKNVRI